MVGNQATASPYRLREKEKSAPMNSLAPIPRFSGDRLLPVVNQRLENQLSSIQAILIKTYNIASLPNLQTTKLSASKAFNITIVRHSATVEGNTRL